MKKIIIVILKFIRGIFRFLFFVISGLTCKMIKLIGGEKEKEKEITVRKAKRIRILTNLKLNAWKYFPHLMNFLGEDKYLEFLRKRLNYGM